MASKKDNDGEIRCSFCGKLKKDAKKLVAGPPGIYICDECIGICSDIIEDDFEDSEVRGQTFRIGQTFDGMEIQLICIGPVTDADQPHPLSGENVVTIAANNGIYLIKECEWR